MIVVNCSRLSKRKRCNEMRFSFMQSSNIHVNSSGSYEYYSIRAYECSNTWRIMKCTNIHEYDAKETKYGEKVKRREKKIQ